MPTYSYECVKCGHSFEKFQNITAPAVKKCPKCEGKVERIIGAGAAVIFKGKGFYQTDYKNSARGDTKTDCASKGCKDTGKCPLSGNNGN